MNSDMEAALLPNAEKVASALNDLLAY